MLQAVFAGHGRFIAFAVLLTLVALAATYAWARRSHPRPLTTSCFAGSTVAVLLLTFWGSGSGYVGNCTVNRQMSEAFLNDQGLLNVALFVPLGFFGALALRQPVAVALGASALSLTIEVVQGTVPVVARVCDSSDWVANSTGAVAGAALGWALTAAATRTRVPAWRGSPRPFAWSFAGVLAVDALAGFLLMQLLFVDATSVQYGSSEMRKAAQARVREAFGTQLTVQKVQYLPGEKFLAAVVGKGSLTMNWPDDGEFSAHFPAYEQGVDPSLVGSVPVANGLPAPKSEQDARTIATHYVQQRFPWALPGSRIASSPVAGGRRGWSVSWRRTVHGVLMPMRLDVEIDRLGRLSGLLVREVADPTHVPAPKLTESQAKAAAHHTPDFVLPPDTTFGNGTLALEQQDGTWHTVWLFPTGIGDETVQVIGIDSITGQNVPIRTQNG
ncbi:VanZ family protein [Streptomyces sp. MI02-7b]|uniref:VanZ family protein n=1 Tax=Streptomyces sp. MI02-7b TaxID=462941 RepID=UPI0029AEB61D|nr:VanZ family protein [Streptomyces sp. MI02-7b]MDX3077017.1 VanZ family protein [Streptomyces sp. MI02-7b]